MVLFTHLYLKELSFIFCCPLLEPCFLTASALFLITSTFCRGCVDNLLAIITRNLCNLLLIFFYCEGCHALVEEINSYQLHPEKRSFIQTPRTQPRHRTPKKLCIVGGLSGFDSPDRYLNRMDYCYLEDEEKWGEMPSMSVARESAGMGI